MAGIFQASDVIKAAVEIETRGEKFYKHLADHATDPETRALFEHLRTEESRHREVFRAMGERLEPFQIPAGADEAEYLAYLNVMLDNHELFMPMTVMSAGQNRQEAIHIAMRFEKDTMLFFMEMREMVPQSKRAVIDQCVDEERGHLKLLTKMLPPVPAEA